MYNVSMFGATVDNENAMQAMIAPRIVTKRQPKRLARELTRGPKMDKRMDKIRKILNFPIINNTDRHLDKNRSIMNHIRPLYFCL